MFQFSIPNFDDPDRYKFKIQIEPRVSLHEGQWYVKIVEVHPGLNDVPQRITTLYGPMATEQQATERAPLIAAEQRDIYMHMAKLAVENIRNHMYLPPLRIEDDDPLTW